MSGQPDSSDNDYNMKERRRAFLADFGVEHDLWTHVERGTQIVTGLFMITMAGFLGESWGGTDVPYGPILRALGWVGYSFLIITLMTPFTILVVIFLRRFTRFDRARRGFIYLVILLGTSSYCWFNLYAGTSDVLQAIAAAQHVELDFGHAYYPQPWRE